MIESEVRKQIPGYENYEVSNTGKVRNRNFNRTGIVKEMTPKRSRVTNLFSYSEAERVGTSRCITW